MLLELLAAISILAVGLAGLMILLVGTMSADGKASGDTSSTMVAEHVMEQISAQPANATGAAALLQWADCTGANHTINTLGSAQGAGSGGSYGGNGARLTASGTVDWSQNYSAVPTDYKMQYVACGAGGRRTIYDVRWDVVTITSFSRMVVVSARPAGATSSSGLRYVVPAQLRTVAGM